VRQLVRELHEGVRGDPEGLRRTRAEVVEGHRLRRGRVPVRREVRRGGAHLRPHPVVQAEADRRDRRQALRAPGVGRGREQRVREGEDGGALQLAVLDVDAGPAVREDDEGHKRMESRNPYGDTRGATIEDPDGYRLVLSTRGLTNS